jgi:hypothetical protein
MLSLTQGHLRQLEICPRRYQYTYVDRYTVPSAPEQWLGQEWGTQFHQVMQQRDLGLPVEQLLRADAPMAAAVEALRTAAPELFAEQPGLFRQSEHRRTLVVNGYLLTAVYDLLLLGDTGGQIVDWKTYQRPPGAAQLAQEWQTRLYLYLLVETSDLSPERVAMVYWFVPPPGLGAAPPSSIALAYTTAQHRRTGADLQRLTDRLSELLAAPGDLPQVEPEQGYCALCPFAVRCQRSSERYGLGEAVDLPAIADIAEIPL